MNTIDKIGIGIIFLFFLYLIFLIIRVMFGRNDENNKS